MTTEYPAPTHLRRKLRPIRGLGLYGAMAFCAIVAVVLGLRNGMLDEKQLLVPTLTLLSTFMGGHLAFRLQLHKEDKAATEAFRFALNHALFILLQQHHAGTVIANKYKARDERPLVRALEIIAFKFPSKIDMLQDIKSLLPMLDTNPAALNNLTLQDANFHVMLSSIELRNSLFVDKIEPLVVKFYEDHPEKYTREDAEKIFGQVLLGQIEQATTTMLGLVDSTQEKTRKIFNEIRNYAALEFPKEKFLDLPPNK